MLESGLVERFSRWCIRRRKVVVSVLGMLTLVLSYFALHVEVKTVFRDMLPTSHPYVRVHEKFKDTFGGSNMVSIMVEAKQGDIFTPGTLKTVQGITNALRNVAAVNDYQIISLGSKKLKEISSSTDGIATKPLMWPDLPRNEPEMAHLKEAVLRNPLVYGTYVSGDMRATLITVDFIDRLVDYERVFVEVQKIVEQASNPSVKISVVGDPILFGWVRHYLPETMHLVVATVATILCLLFLFMRTWRGTLLPLLAGLISAVWALGIIKILGIHFEPLVMVVAILISARAVSHSVQIVNRYDEEIAKLHDLKEGTQGASRVALTDMFRPGMLGIIADAGCMVVVALSPIPLLQKLTVLSVVWVGTLAVSAVILTPVLLAFSRRPGGYAHRIDTLPLLQWLLGRCVALTLGRGRYVVLACAALLFLASGVYSLNLKIGDANPGSPVLWPDAQYNQASRAINDKFPGVDRMFVVVGNEQERDFMKRADVLDHMARFQQFMSAQPEIGGTVSLANVVPAVNRIIHEGNPRYEELGADQKTNGSLLYLFDSVSEPGDSERFVDSSYQHGSITLYFRDRQGETIRTAVSRIQEFIDKNPLKDGSYQLAGGGVGVLAAVNEIILSGQIEAIAFALVVLVIICTITYRSPAAGMLFMVPVILSNTITFSVMTLLDIGMSINTVPVTALGIGLGVDYAFYIADRVKEELAMGRTAEAAIANALRSTGVGVVITALVLIISVLVWSLSSLRFQAEMGLLMAVWLAVSAASALTLVPSMIYVFRPEFIFGSRSDAEHGLQARAAAA